MFFFKNKCTSFVMPKATTLVAGKDFVFDKRLSLSKVHLITAGVSDSLMNYKSCGTLLSFRYFTSLGYTYICSYFSEPSSKYYHLFIKSSTIVKVEKEKGFFTWLILKISPEEEKNYGNSVYAEYSLKNMGGYLKYMVDANTTKFVMPEGPRVPGNPVKTPWFVASTTFPFSKSNCVV